MILTEETRRFLTWTATLVFFTLTALTIAGTTQYVDERNDHRATQEATK